MSTFIGKKVTTSIEKKALFDVLLVRVVREVSSKKTPSYVNSSVTEPSFRHISLNKQDQGRI